MERMDMLDKLVNVRYIHTTVNEQILVQWMKNRNKHVKYETPMVETSNMKTPGFTDRILCKRIEKNYMT
jgi:hypothetical protein